MPDIDKYYLIVEIITCQKLQESDSGLTNNETIFWDRWASKYIHMSFEQLHDVCNFLTAIS